LLNRYREKPRIMIIFPRVYPDIQNYNILNTILPVLIKILPLKIAKPTRKSFGEGCKGDMYI
jgi:hypothetical protein